ncbi:MAG: response regulator, partial [Candidatus Wallbacteria bacterium]|nr:response regulator [Candidatus Wallbacteria bacterium]
MSVKPRILIVDDEPSNIDVLLSVFGEGYQVIVARNGEQGLARAAGDKPPDIVLLDVQMPGLSGYEVCRRLKAAEETRSNDV